MTFQTHFNPTVTLSLDFRSDYNFVSRTIPNNAISGWYRWKSGFLNATFVRQKTPGDLSVTSQFRIGSGSVFLNRKLTLDGEVGYDLEGTSVMDWRARLAYYTQCCGFMIEYLDRNFVDNPRREIHFAIDLKGIGRFLEPNVSLAR
jgi:hypothetical protein